MSDINELLTIDEVNRLKVKLNVDDQLLKDATNKGCKGILSFFNSKYRSLYKKLNSLTQPQEICYYVFHHGKVLLTTKDLSEANNCAVLNKGSKVINESTAPDPDGLNKFYQEVDELNELIMDNWKLYFNCIYEYVGVSDPAIIKKIWQFIYHDRDFILDTDDDSGELNQILLFKDMYKFYQSMSTAELKAVPPTEHDYKILEPRKIEASELVNLIIEPVK